MTFLRVTNGTAVACAKIPLVSMELFVAEVTGAVAAGGRLAALLGQPRPGGGADLYAVLAMDAESALWVGRTEVGSTYPSLTQVCPQAHWD